LSSSSSSDSSSSSCTSRIASTSTTHSTPPILHVEVADKPKWDYEPIIEHIMGHGPF
jgi:hypothetical protein